MEIRHLKIIKIFSSKKVWKNKYGIPYIKMQNFKTMEAINIEKDVEGNTVVTNSE